MADIMEALTVREYTANDGTEKSSWTKIGISIPNRNGEGYTIILDALPLDGKIVVRPKKNFGNKGGGGSGGYQGGGPRDPEPPPPTDQF